jgi:hypothetical protein
MVSGCKPFASLLKIRLGGNETDTVFSAEPDFLNIISVHQP